MGQRKITDINPAIACGEPGMVGGDRSRGEYSVVPFCCGRVEIGKRAHGVNRWAKYLGQISEHELFQGVG